MKNRFFLSLVFALFVICSFGQILCKAQAYNQPKRLLLKGDKVKEDSESRTLLKELFYPLGWSKDGKFAYYTEPPDEACGCYFGYLVIQDLRTDKVLWEKNYEGSMEKQENLQTVWRKLQKEFSQKLAEHGIVAQKRFSLQNSAFKYKKDLLTPKLTNTVKADGTGVDTSGNLVVQLISKQKGKKTLYEKSFDPEKFDTFMDVEFSGGLLSPFEPRAVVILIETHRGYEGPPNTTRIRIVGADLEKSFQK